MKLLNISCVKNFDDRFKVSGIEFILAFSKLFNLDLIPNTFNNKFKSSTVVVSSKETDIEFLSISLKLI